MSREAAMTMLECRARKKPDCDWTLALLHQFACDIIDRGDVIGVDRMPQPEAVGDERRRQQQRMAAEHGIGPGPGQQIGRDKDGVKLDHFGSNIAGSVVEDAERQQSSCLRQMRSA
jgi:hypothetical protein